MAKGIKITLISVVVIIVVGFLILTLALDSFVKSNIEKVGSEMTGTIVTVGGVSISPFSGQGTITHLRVANPDGYGTENAIVVDDLFIKLNVRSLWSDVIEIEEIVVTAPAIYVEQQMPGNNLRTILNNINDAASRGTPTESEMVIGRFLLKDGTVDLYTEIGGERSARVEMSEIELTNLGSDNGREATEQVVRQIADRVVEQALQAALQSGAEQLRDAIEDLFN
ncbi:MAG: hypothetical protein ACNA8K_01660 [Cyclonatronaceae bacterium]